MDYTLHVQGRRSPKSAAGVWQAFEGVLGVALGEAHQVTSSESPQTAQDTPALQTLHTPALVRRGG